MARKSDKAKLIFLMLYFLILTVERVISLAAVFTGDFSGYDFLEWYIHALPFQYRALPQWKDNDESGA